MNKYGLDVFILENNLTEEEAFQIEMKYINRVRRRDLGTGTLVNMTDGGEGSVGHIHSEETKLKMSEVHKGNKYAKGMKHSEETRMKISEGNKSKNVSEETKLKMSEAHKGKKMSDEARRKISESVKKCWADRKAKATE